jgi:hypothetical protein
MYQKNQSDFTTSAIDLLLVSTLKAETIVLANAALASTVAGLPASSTAIVYADGGTFTGSATKTALGTTAGALYQVTSAAGGTVASITVVTTGPNSAAGKTIIFSEKTLASGFGVSAAEALTYTGAVFTTGPDTLTLDNSNGGVNPSGGWTVGDTFTFGANIQTNNGGFDFGAATTVVTITSATATGFTGSQLNIPNGETATYVSGDIVYSGNSGVSGVITYTPATANLEVPSTNFTQQPVALYVGVAGDITLTLASDSTEVKFVGVAAGTFLDVLCTSVNTAAAGTPASGLLALR